MLRGMNTMELTDLEICKKIAEIEGVNFDEVEGKIIKIRQGKVTMHKEYCDLNGMMKKLYASGNIYNPLTDDALWVNLIEKYEVSISFVFCKVLIHHRGVHERNFTDKLSLRRSALLVIIEAHNNT